MTSEEFDEMLDARPEKIKTTLAPEVAGRVKGGSPERSLHSIIIKHVASVADLIEAADSEPAKLSESFIDKRIGDFINDLSLLRGFLKQRCRHNYVEVFKKSFDSCSKTPEIAIQHLLQEET